MQIAATKQNRDRRNNTEMSRALHFTEHTRTQTEYYVTHIRFAHDLGKEIANSFPHNVAGMEAGSVYALLRTLGDLCSAGYAKEDAIICNKPNGQNTTLVKVGGEL